MSLFYILSQRENAPRIQVTLYVREQLRSAYLLCLAHITPSNQIDFVRTPKVLVRPHPTQIVTFEWPNQIETFLVLQQNELRQVKYEAPFHLFADDVDQFVFPICTLQLFQLHVHRSTLATLRLCSIL